MSFLEPFHPRVVHFPIALLLTGVAFMFLGILREQQRWREYGRLSLFLGWVGVLAGAGTGLIDQSAAPDTAAVQSTLNQHITVGILLIVVFGLALYWPLRNHNVWVQSQSRALYLALLVLGALLVLLEGWLGGILVYHLGVGVAAN